MENTSPNIRIAEFLDKYVMSSDPRYAVMLTGTWGCGKTYFIKRWKDNLEDKITKNGKYSSLNKPIYVSLFGLSSIQDINEALTREIYPFMKTRAFKFGKKALKAVSSVALRCDLTKDDDTLLDKANIQLDLVSLFRSEYDEQEERRTIIFDDFERCKMPYVDLLGYINQFVEHSNIRVIILCHEEEVKGVERDDYARFKEKLIGRTFKIEPDTLAVISDFCEQLGLLELDEEQKQMIERVFEVVGYNNLRSLYQALLDFSNLGIEYKTDNAQQKEKYERLLIQYVVAYCEYAANERVREVATHCTSFKSVFRYYVQDTRLTTEDKRIYGKYRRLAGYHPDGWLFGVPMPFILHSIAEGEDLSNYLVGLLNESENDKPIHIRIANYSTMENDVFDSTYKEAMEYTLNPFSDVVSIIKTLYTLHLLDLRKIREYYGWSDCLKNISTIVKSQNDKNKLFLWYDYVKADLHDGTIDKMIDFEKSVLRELSDRLLVLQEKELQELCQINNDNFEKTISKYFSLYRTKEESAFAFTPIFDLIDPTGFANALSSLSNNNKLRFRKLLLGRYEKKVPKGSTLYSFFENEINNLRGISKQLKKIASTKADIDKTATQELSIAFSFAADKIDAVEYYNRGISYFKEEEFDDAIQAFTKAIVLNLKYAYAYYYRGVCYYRKREVQNAIEDYTEAIRLKSDYAEAYNNRGACYARKGKPDKAIADYTEAIRLKPDYAEAYNNRGACCARKGEPDKAIADYTEAIRLKPDYAEAYYNRGFYYGQKGETDNAIADYTEAIKLKPDYAKAYFNRGICYGQKGETDKEIADYTEAIRLNPDDAAAYFNRGICYGQKGEPDKAIADYTEAIDLDPYDANAWYYRGICYGKKGELDKAIADYTETIRLKPNYVKAYFNRGKCHDQDGVTDQAIVDYTEAIRLRPGYAEAFYKRGLCYEQNGETDKAIEDYTEAIRLKPDYAEAYNNRGACYARKGKPDKAIADYTEAIRLNPDDAAAYFNRGICYGQKGEPDKAIADYTEAIDLDPYDANAWYYRGICYGKKGELDKAIAGYTQAIRLYPDDAEAYYNRGLCFDEKGELDKAIADYAEAIRLKPDYAEAYNNLADVLCQQKDFEKALPYANKAIELEPDGSVFCDTRCDVYMGLQQWENALDDVNRGLEIAKRNGEKERIESLEPKKKSNEEEIKKQNNNEQQN